MNLAGGAQGAPTASTAAARSRRVSNRSITTFARIVDGSVQEPRAGNIFIWPHSLFRCVQWMSAYPSGASPPYHLMLGLASVYSIVALWARPLDLSAAN